MDGESMPQGMRKTGYLMSEARCAFAGVFDVFHNRSTPCAHGYSRVPRIHSVWLDLPEATSDIRWQEREPL
jgi:hypothetical protein